MDLPALPRNTPSRAPDAAPRPSNKAGCRPANGQTRRSQRAVSGVPASKVDWQAGDGALASVALDRAL